MRGLRVLLDANVIVDAQVRDLLCRLAEAELIELRWSSRILEESRRALTDKLGLDPLKVERLITALMRAFPDASVTAFDELVDHLILPDPDDRHVLAAAVHGECDLLITYNISDFPDTALEQFDLLVLSVDDSLTLLARSFQTKLAEVVDRQIAALRRPQMSRELFLERLALRAPMGAVAIGNALGVKYM